MAANLRDIPNNDIVQVTKCAFAHLCVFELSVRANILRFAV
ncbi:hypothetical protein JCM19237_4885 [Photobacterium aphoticum]|uniref:Uncharacterized protein n=1 Tax=Photobacterium aphoticum TaxID=754436 RepID=A0A090RE12_9GAMM|nr:hypothetical protein JCM19237_4885 [Photobacterium aphoticum]